MNVALKAVVGCAAGELRGIGCGPGAAATMTEGLLQETGVFDALQARGWGQIGIRNFTKVASGLAAGAAAGSQDAINQGADLGVSAFNNNYLSHFEMVEKVGAQQALAECEATSACSDDEITKLRAEILQWTLLDEARDLEIQQFCAQGNALGCIGVYNELGEMLAEDRAFYDTLDPDSALAQAVLLKVSKTTN